jgi:hypothetical protein
MEKGTRLVDQISSTFIKAQNKLADREGEIIAYVENEPDVPFWRKVFKQFASDLKVNIKPGVHGSSERGKQTLLKFKERLGKELLLCLDSDYDYLLQNHTEDSRVINNNEFIFQTYTYSVENYRCFSENLDHVCEETSHSLNDLFDFEEFNKAFSKIIYKPLLYSVLCHKMDSGNLSSKKLGKLISVELTDEILFDMSKAFQKLEIEAGEKVEELKNEINVEDFDKFSQEAEQLGLNEENAYLFVSGHAIYDKVAFKLVEFVTKKLRNQKVEEFKQTETDLKKKRSEYYNQISEPKQVLKSSYDFWSCELMNKIEEDILNYYKKYHS